MEVKELETKKKPMTILGYHNEDLITEVDLTKIDAGEDIIFKEGMFRIKKGTSLKIQYAQYTYTAQINFSGNRTPDLSENYYCLKAGAKYDLETPIIRTAIEPLYNGSSENDYVVIPAKSKHWGGGGLNLALTVRSLSPYDVTPINYVDISSSNSIKECLYDIQQVAPLNVNKDVPINDDDVQIAIANILAKYRPELCIETYLASSSITYTTLHSEESLNRTNIVFSKITDGTNLIGDRIILVSPSQTPGSNEYQRSQDIDNSLSKTLIDSGSLIIDTINHYKLFKSVINAWNLADEDTRPKTMVAFTSKNIKWFSKARKEKNGKKKCREFLKNTVCIFNESEFAEYLSEIKRIKINKDMICFADGSPNLSELSKLLVAYRRDFEASLPKRVYITFGKYGSVGVDEKNSIVYTGTYPTRGVTIYDTTGCGDAWFGAIALLEHHHGWKRPTQKKESKKFSLSRFMRVASGVAVAKMTNPLGIAKKDEVIFLLDTSYIPWVVVGTCSKETMNELNIDEKTKRCNRIEHADSINYRDYINILYSYGK
jgi:sugar/nucleoside kinase (ribokinase family)